MDMEMSYRFCAALLLLLTPGLARADDPIVIGQTSRIRSDVLHEERALRIYLPRSYGWAADRRYPVLYLLDAETDFVHTASSVDYLAAMGEIPEMIVVGVDSTVRVRDFTQTDWPEAWVGGGGAANFKAFLSKELLPKVDGSYRTNGYRVLSGHSAGGQFALYCLTSDPSLFQAYFALSPSLEWDHELPQRSLEKALASTESLKAFLYVARSDDFGRALAMDERLVHTLETTAPRGFRWASGAFPEESHGSVTLLAEIDALRRLFSGYRLSNDVLDLGIDFVLEHFEVQSKVVGYPIGVPEGAVNDLGYSALSAGKTADAVALFRRNVEANPNSANAWDSLADGYEKAGRWQDAAGAADHAVDLAARFDDPNRASFVAHAKKMHDRLSETSKGEPVSHQ
jgi:predicted alpha/beta superfamily hydrolase